MPRRNAHQLLTQVTSSAKVDGGDAVGEPAGGGVGARTEEVHAVDPVMPTVAQLTAQRVLPRQAIGQMHINMRTCVKGGQVLGSGPVGLLGTGALTSPRTPVAHR